MGLMVHSLGELPENVERSYYIYVLDYGWHESLGEALRKNLPKMMDLASKNDAVVIKGIESNHFDNEVFSWHGINGEPSDDILPAILITTLHPHYFRQSCRLDTAKKGTNENLLLIPLRKVCKTSNDVVDLIIKIFSDIENKKALCDFSIHRQIPKRGQGWRSIFDALILEPNIGGVGIDIKRIGQYFSTTSNSKSDQ